MNFRNIKNSSNSQSGAQENVYIAAEANANSVNLNCLAFIAIFAVLAFILNELGVFIVDRSVMSPVIFASTLCFLAPVLAVSIHDSIAKDATSLLERPWLKVAIIFAAYIGIALVCIVLSFHAVLVMALPPLMVAQYRYSRPMAVFIFASTILFVPIAVFGGYFYGLADMNFFGDDLTTSEAAIISNRMELMTPQRVVEVVLHYVLPRLLEVVLIDVLVIGVAKRNEQMVDSQYALMQVARDEAERRNNLQNKVIEDLAGVIETRDVGTGEHVIRTKRYVGIIARALQERDKYKDVLTDNDVVEIESAAPLHDIGKIAVPDYILLKPGRLTTEEFEIMKTHSAKGGEMVKNIFVNFSDKDFLDKAYNIASFHHEKWDGSGYPQGLKGENIPLEARIMAVADVYDALVSKRVYKDPISSEEAFKVIVDGSGSHFDPDIVRVLMEIKEDFVAASLE